MDTLIIWVYILKRFQSKERHNFICYLKKLKYNAFPLKFPICSFVAQLDQIITVSFSRQRQTVLCSYRTKAPIQNWNSWKSSSTTTSKFHVKFFVNYLKPLIISLPWQGKPKRERPLNEWNSIKSRLCQNPGHTTLDCLQSQGILIAKMH